MDAIKLGEILIDTINQVKEGKLGTERARVISDLAGNGVKLLNAQANALNAMARADNPHAVENGLKAIGVINSNINTY